MQGTRHDVEPSELPPGGYGRALDGTWYCRPPEMFCNPHPSPVKSLAGHTILESSGTVVGAISFGDFNLYLVNGDWRECP